MVSVLTQIFLLAAALSADIFAVGFTYGTGGIRLSPAAAFLLTGIPAVILTLSMGLGGAAGSYFPEIAVHGSMAAEAGSTLADWVSRNI